MASYSVVTVEVSDQIYSGLKLEHHIVKCYKNVEMNYFTWISCIK